MTVTDLLMHKKDLCTYSDRDLRILQDYYNVSANTRDDLCWILSLKIAENSHKGTMLRALHKKGPIASTSGFADMYNLKPEECRWPTRMGGFLVKDCAFGTRPYETVRVKNPFTNTNITLDIVELPARSHLYTGTKNPARVYNSSSDWPSTRGFVWFASTKDHTMPLGPVKIHTFVTNEPLLLLYVHNMTTELNISTGANFALALPKIRNEILKGTGINIDGYLGCNECEFGLFNSSLDKLQYPSSISNPPYIE